MRNKKSLLKVRAESCRVFQAPQINRPIKVIEKELEDGGLIISAKNWPYHIKFWAHRALLDS